MVNQVWGEAIGTEAEWLVMYGGEGTRYSGRVVSQVWGREH